MRRPPLAARLATAVVLACAAMGFGAAGVQAAPPLVAQYGFDGAFEDGANSVTPDGSGNGLALRGPAGAIRVGTPPRFGNGALLPSNVTTLQVTSPLFSPSQVTLLAWIKRSGFPGNLKYVAGRGDDGAICGGSSYAIYTGYPGNEGLRFYTRRAGQDSLLTDVAPSAVWDGQWHLVAGTYDGTAARFYVDGTLVGTPKVGSGSPDYALGGGTSFYVDGYPVQSCELSPNADDFPGQIDDVRVYDRALSGTELARLAASTGPNAPELITDASLLPPPAAPVVEPSQGAQQPQAPAAPKPAPKVVQQATLAQAVAAVKGASGKAAPPSMQAAVSEAQAKALEAMTSAAGASHVSAAKAAQELSAKEAKQLRPDSRLQARLEAMKYGIAAQVPAPAAGQVVEAVATLVLQKKRGGKVTTQQITLPPAVGVAGAQKQAEVYFPVDQKATAAMTRKDVAKAAIAIQGASIDAMSEMGEMESLRLQMAMDRLSKVMSTLSNILKKTSDTANTITQNLKGGLTEAERKENDRAAEQARKLDKQLRDAEAQRDAANLEAAKAAQQAMQNFAGALVGSVGQGGAGKMLPAAVAPLKGCKTCELAAQRSK